VSPVCDCDVRSDKHRTRVERRDRHFGALQFGLGAVGGGNLIKVEMGHLAMGALTPGLI
jgi:hypothetical protein